MWWRAARDSLAIMPSGSNTAELNRAYYTLYFVLQGLTNFGSVYNCSTGAIKRTVKRMEYTMDGLMGDAKGGEVDSPETDAGLMGGGGEDAELDTETDADGKPDADADDPGEHDDAKKEKIPEHAQKMIDKKIGKLVGRAKTAEERAERAESELKGLRERVDAEDAEIVLDVARNLGVLAETLPKGAAKGMEQLRFAQNAVETLQEKLEDATGDEVEIDGKNYSKADVRAKLKEYRSMEKRLSSMYGGIEAQARKDMMEIIRLGQQAKKANWKPGSKVEAVKPKEEPPKKQRTEDGGRRSDVDDDEPASRVRGAEEGRRGADDSRGDDEPFSLERFYEEQEKAKKSGRK